MVMGYRKKLKKDVRSNLLNPTKNRCAVDTAWQKRGFDSLTCKFSI